MRKRNSTFNNDPRQYVIDFDFDDEPETGTNPAFRYISFGSGSSGNSCYIGNDNGGLLVDAGIKLETVQETLNANGISIDKVKGILLTHDHSDHVHYVYKYLRKWKNLDLLCTNRVLKGLLTRHNISKRVTDYHRPIFKEIPFEAAGFTVTAFEVPHDGSDNMGFSISLGDRNFVLATDIGAVTARARHYMSLADYLVIEANYDAAMLRNGRYPEYLKARIATDNGHLCNDQTAQFLGEIAASDRLKWVFLCHLSKDNNTPEIALETVRKTLLEKGLNIGRTEETIADRSADLRLGVLPRYNPTRLFVLRD